MKPRTHTNESEIEELGIANLVPGERYLDRDAVAEYIELIRNGREVETPRAIRFGNLYLIRDGNHRVMAYKMCGFTTVRCSVQPKRLSRGTSDFDEDSFHKFVALGLQGFENTALVTKKEKEEAYAREDDEMLDEAFDGLIGDEDSHASGSNGADVSDDDFFK